MEGISKEELIRIKETMPDGNSRLFMYALVIKCKELPDQQWQTIDEFKANPVEGWCWIQHKYLKTTMSHYRRVFAVDGEMLADEYITHVIPIKTPEAPK